MEARGFELCLGEGKRTLYDFGRMQPLTFFTCLPHSDCHAGQEEEVERDGTADIAFFLLHSSSSLSFFGYSTAPYRSRLVWAKA